MFSSISTAAEPRRRPLAAVWRISEILSICLLLWYTGQPYATGERELTVDAGVPGGNIVVERVQGDDIYVHQDLRDTQGDWFYWHFRVRGAEGRTLRVHFTQSNVIGVRGPAVSIDGGGAWEWLGASAVEDASFTFAVPGDVPEVRFCMGMPYTAENLHAFLADYAGHPNLKVDTLNTSLKGRPIEKIVVGSSDDRCKHRILVTCRHHACEMMASYCLEGIIESVLANNEEGRWFQDNVEFLIVPFVDKDGVEDGDQGKNRKPYDHNRDYNGESIYPAVRTLRELVPAWSGGKLRLAFDLHDPWIRGKHNESIYFVGGENATHWKRVSDFSSTLERVQRGPLVFHAENNLPFGQSWNTRKNYGNHKSCKHWAGEQDGIWFSTTMELPYANADGREVNTETARAFGHDLARAMRRSLVESGMGS